MKLDDVGEERPSVRMELVGEIRRLLVIRPLRGVAGEEGFICVKVVVKEQDGLTGKEGGGFTCENESLLQREGVIAYDMGRCW